MLKSNWYHTRPCKLVTVSHYNNNVRSGSGCSNPLWIFEGIARILRLTNKPFPLQTPHQVTEGERNLHDNNIAIHSNVNM